MDIYAQVTCDCCKTAKTEVLANNPTELTFYLAAERWVQMDGKHYCPECSHEMIGELS